MVNMPVGSRVRVTKLGLKNTGQVGTVVAIPADRPHIREVQLDDGIKGKTIKFKALSITEIKVKRKLIIPKRPRCVLVGTAKKYDAIKLRHTEKPITINGDEVALATLKGNIRRKVKDVVGIISHDDELTFKRPEKDDFPFWIWDEAERKDCYRDFQNIENVLCFAGKGHNYRLKWLDISSCKPRYEDVIEEPKQPIAAPKNELQRAIQLTTELAKDNQTRGLCFGLVYRNKNNEVKTVNRTGAACHYSMQTLRGNLPDGDNYRQCTPLYGVQYITDKHKFGDDKLLDEYLTWVMNDSPWSQYIITKKLADGKKHGVLINADIPDNALMCTFYALRYPTEYPATIRRWKEWVDAGMNPTGAYFAAETANFEEDQLTPHHGLLDTGKMNLDDLKNFINHGVGRVVRPEYTETWGYGNVSAHHGSRKDGRYNDTALKEMQALPDLFEVKKANGPMARDKKIVNKEKMVEYINAMKG